MKDLRKKTVHGGVARLLSQAINFGLRFFFLVILARLLDPKDFGLVAMVTVVTGVYEIFTSAGLSLATIQQPSITNSQISGLFWVNLLVGAILAILCVVTAPVLVMFYHEPRLYWVTVAMAAGFLFNGAGVQHYALLQRQLRYPALAVIEALSQIVSIAVGVGMALRGLGYWALVGAAIVLPAVRTASAWVFTAWIPGMPRRSVGIDSMIHFGVTVTLNAIVVYIAYNFDKVLIGRFWGADALGIYGRAYQLINIPTANLNAAMGDVGISVLSRLQDDPIRFKKYFVKAYSMAIALSIPVTIFCALFADDIILILFGQKWKDAIVVFRLLAPTILIFAMINPLSWLLISSGLQKRSLQISLVIAPTVITAYLIALPYGINGVAFAYSVVMTLAFIPLVLWAVHNTVISARDLFGAIGAPFLSGIAAAAFAFGAQFYFGQVESSVLRLLLGGTVMICVYYFTLLFVMGQRTFYLDLLRGLINPLGSA